MFFSKKKPITPKNKLPQKLATLKNAPQPAWVWDSEYRTIFWANLSGLEFWGVSSREEIKELCIHEDHSMVLICDKRLKKITNGQILYETMNFLVDRKSTDFTCKLTVQDLPDGRNGVLIVVDTLQSEDPEYIKRIDLTSNATDNIIENAKDKQQQVSKTMLSDDIMLENPPTFSCNSSGVIVGVNDVASQYLSLNYGDNCIAIFTDKQIGQQIIKRILTHKHTSFVEKIDIGFGVCPYLIQATQFIYDDAPHFNMGILRISEEKYQEFLSNQSENIVKAEAENIVKAEAENIVKAEAENIVENDDFAINNQQAHNLKHSVTKNYSFKQDKEENFVSPPSVNELTELVGIDVGIFDVNQDGTIKAVNQVACKVTGYDKDSLLEKNVIHLFGAEAEPVLSDLILNSNRAILDDLADGVQCQYYDVHNIHHIIKLIVRSNRAKNGFWFIVNDNTELETIKSELSDLKKYTQDNPPVVVNHTNVNKTGSHLQIPSLVNAVSHEIRAPLNAIAGYAEMIESEIFGKLPDSRYKEFASSIRGAGEYALSIVNELLDYSKLKAGGFTANLVNVDIEKITTEAISTVYPQARMRNIEIVKTILTGTPCVRSDARLLKQVLINLLMNAIKYSHDSEQILLTAGLTKTGRLMIEITDFGRGMTEQEITEALIPFMRGHYDNDVPGTGLGLALSKELTELTHGRFMIDSIPKERTRVRVIYEEASIIKG
jgi:signal transduction histidine kinase